MKFSWENVLVKIISIFLFSAASSGCSEWHTCESSSFLGSRLHFEHGFLYQCLQYNQVQGNSGKIRISRNEVPEVGMGRRSRKFKQKSRRGHSIDVKNSKDWNTRSFHTGPGTSVTAVRYREQKLATQTLSWAWLESRRYQDMAEQQKSEHRWLLIKDYLQVSVRAIRRYGRVQSVGLWGLECRWDSFWEKQTWGSWLPT